MNHFCHSLVIFSSLTFHISTCHVSPCFFLFSLILCWVLACSYLYTTVLIFIIFFWGQGNVDFILLPSPHAISLWHGHWLFAECFILRAQLTACSCHSDWHHLFLKYVINPKIVVDLVLLRLKHCNGLHKWLIWKYWGERLQERKNRKLCHVQKCNNSVW